MVKKNYLSCSCILVSTLAACTQSPPLTHSQPSSSNEKCQISITSPMQNSVVTDNNDLSHIGLFSFSVSGTVSNLGNDSVCVYQKIPGGHEWWRSGGAVNIDDLGPNGSWSIMHASCGKKNNPHPACQVKAVVQGRCPSSGSNHTSIGAYRCATENYTFKTK